MSEHHKNRGFRHLKNHEKFRVIKKNCAKGARGKISVVKRRSDHELLIWKRPKSRNRMYLRSYAKEIKKIAQWRKFGLTNVKVCWCRPKKHGIVKTYVKGPTLKQIVRHNRRLFSKSQKHNKYVKSLIRFLHNLADTGHYIHDLKMSNIIYNKHKHKYELIDSGPIHKKSKSSARKEHQKMLYKKWRENIPHHESDNLKDFLKKYLR